MYQEPYLLYLLIFSFSAYLIATDDSVAKFFLLYLKVIKNNIERFFWMVRFHPLVTTNKITQWFMMRKYMKDAEKMQKELFKND
jgi:hypothetical protein